MNNIKPKFFSLIVSTFVTVIFLILAITTVGFATYLQWFILLATAFILFCFSYFIYRYYLEKFIYEKIRLIYKTIHILKTPKKEKSVFNETDLLEEAEEEVSAEEEALYVKLRLPISELELSVRSSNCLKDANIKTISDLVRRQEPELLEFRNFGKKSLTEIQDILKAMGLNLGMKVDTKKLRTK